MKNLISGAKLGRYEIRSKIGAGGMGEVYLAQDTKLDRKVALKILPSELATNQDRMRRFTQEAKAAAALNHPNIAHIYEIGESQGTHFIAMEFVDGVTLRAKIHRHQAPLAKLLKYLTQVAEGLSKAHAAGIVHRDLKPDNIMITRDDYAKILDFGLAKLVEAPEPKPDREGGVGSDQGSSEIATAIMPLHTTPGMVMGTAGYMSPEQAQGKTKEIDHRSDIFSFGCVLFEAATGQKPFAGESIIKSLHKIVYEPAPAIADLNPSAPPDLQRIVRRCLAKEPDERYQTVRDVALDLGDISRGLETAPARPIVSEPTQTTTNAALTKQRARRRVFRTSNRVLVAITALALLITVALVYSLFLRRAPAGSPLEIKSLAVLPLENLSGDPAQDYFADGMTEAVIAELSKISALRVISRQSMMQYKGTRKTTPEIARDLNVDAIVEGSIVRSGDRVGITVKLIRAAKEEQPLWTESYQRDLRDILALQSEIGRAIATEIRVKLTPQEKSLLARARPVNPEAHEAYLKGLQFFNQGINERKEDLLRKSFEYLEQAIKIQPDYGLAHAQLARSYHWLGWSSPEFLPKAKAEAIKALQIDETLAQAHSALGFTIFRLDWDWAGAEKEFKRAIELDPNYSEAHHAYALYLSAAGRHTEALAEITRAQDLDPLTLPLKVNIGITYLHARQYDGAIEQFRNALDLNPDNPGVHTCLGVAYVYKRMYEKGIEEFQQVIALSESGLRSQANAAWVYALSGKAGGDPRKKANLAWAYAMSGKRDSAIRILNELRGPSKQESPASFSIASIYAAFGEKDQALEWLQRVYEDHAWVILYINCYPEFDSLRSDARFQDLTRRIGLPPP